MKKVCKVILVLLLLFGIACAVLLFSLNPIIQRLTPTINRKLSEAIHHPLSFGKISVSLFPRVGITLDEVSLHREQGALADAANIKSLVLETGLLSLLRGNVLVTKLLVTDGDVLVRRTKDGRILVGGTDVTHKNQASPPPTEAPPAQAEIVGTTGPSSPSSPPSHSSPSSASSSTSPSPSPSSAAEEKGSLDFAIEDTDISRIKLRFIDETVSPAADIAIEISRAFAKGISTMGQGTVKLTGSVLGKQKDNLRVDGTFSFARTSFGLPSAAATLSLSALDLAQVTNLLALYHVKTGELSLSDSLSFRLNVKSDNDGISISPALEATAGGITYGTIFRNAAGVPLRLSFNAKPTLFGDAQLKDLDFQLANIHVAAPSAVIQRGKNVSARVNAKSIALKDLAPLFPVLAPYNLQGVVSVQLDASVPLGGGNPDIRGTVTLDKVSAMIPQRPTAEGGLKAETAKSIPIERVDGKLDLAGQNASIKPLDVVIAGQEFHAGAQLRSLPSPDVDFALQSQRLALGPLLAVTTSSGIPALKDSYLTNLQLTSSFSKQRRNARVSVTAGESNLANNPVASIKLAATMTLLPDNSLESLTLQPTSLQLFGGTLGLDGSLSADGQGKINVNGYHMNLKDISSAAMQGSAVSLEGSLDSLSAQLGGVTKNFSETIDGPVRASAAKGSIIGFNLLRETLGRAAAIPGMGAALLSYIPEKYQPLLQSNGTPFEILTLQAMLHGRSVDLESVALNHALYIVTGSGRIDIGAGLDLKVQLKLTPILTQGMVLKEPRLKLLVDNKGNMVIPVVIRKRDGSLTVLPDTNELGKRALSNTAKEAATRALDKVSPGLGGVIDSIFKK